MAVLRKSKSYIRKYRNYPKQCDNPTYIGVNGEGGLAVPPPRAAAQPRGSKMNTANGK
jgi:hypothetical protein